MASKAPKPVPKSGGDGPDRKGSVKHARQMLEAGMRPGDRRQPAVPSNAASDPARMTNWPLPDNTTLAPPPTKPYPSKGPPPQRPPHPSDIPSPSVYSVNSVSDYAPSPLHIRRDFPPVPPVSQEQMTHYQIPRQQILHQQMAYRQMPPPKVPQDRYDDVDSPTDTTPRISIATEELFRQSGTSSVGTIPDFPVALADSYHIHNNANLAPVPPYRQSQHPFNIRGSAVSPIPEELTESPSGRVGSFASSRVIPSSWGSAPAESEILGAYLNDDETHSKDENLDMEGNAMLLRSASVGTRGKPSLRTIQKPNTESSVTAKDAVESDVVSAPVAKEVLTDGHRVTRFEVRNSNSTVSSEKSYHYNIEKTPLPMPIPVLHPSEIDMHADDLALEKELGSFPKPAPTMSDKRPMGRRPPRLNMGAVKDAEARGSLTSLPDLIKRATRLASNLEHGRTASKANALNDFDGPNMGRGSRHSGSISDILNSFPNPTGQNNSNAHSSWPVFFRRSTLHKIDSGDQNVEGAAEGSSKRQRRCCGMPTWVFVLVCVLVVIVVLLAVLLPIFLVVLRHHSSSSSSCATTNPCKNGGVSVSSGDICSCVCSNGYTGKHCTVAGDSSCVTMKLSSSEATVGSSLPALFEASESNFSIPLDTTTILALFSASNVTCRTENALVSFEELDTSSKRRRSLADLPVEGGDNEPNAIPPSITTFVTSTPTLAARDSIETVNGIVFDDVSQTASATTSTTASTSSATGTATSTSSTATTTTATTTATATATATSTATSVSTTVLDFSKIAVLFIFEQTGDFDIALDTESAIQAYLSKGTSSSSNSSSIDLEKFGVDADYTLDFSAYTITASNGTVIGGSS
ncbi:hypothetical protein ASPZODRAFT_154654 [Penicilliopsis zonata CBS 506.65]|uniref:EGF-like domain-containing protein n=1 Tax=Penicilliopsis zonata CBS 506.65 TaxID=1073090 RepID=A0A1L9S8F2_9EURO|nr:hypothetical protein ASPZODRAFT_154654 [Penicilliopsis zonata CBS 506.65]OJJ43440.1 hypothetical protein ASPZODRAFT_154654 [Penicilliopsis zonata CBS 506.65]